MTWLYRLYGKEISGFCTLGLAAVIALLCWPVAPDGNDKQAGAINPRGVHVSVIKPATLYSPGMRPAASVSRKDA